MTISVAALLLAGCVGAGHRAESQTGSLRFGNPEGTTTTSACTPMESVETEMGMAGMAENVGTKDIRVTKVELANLKGLEPEAQLIREVGDLGLEMWTSRGLNHSEWAAVVDPLAPLDSFVLKPGKTAIVAVKTTVLDVAAGGSADHLVVTYQETESDTEYVVKGNESFAWREGKC